MEFCEKITQSYYYQLYYTISSSVKVFKLKDTHRLRAALTHRIPQRHLPFTHATEAGTQDLPIRNKHRSHRPGAFVRFLLLLQGAQYNNVSDMNVVATKGSVLFE